MLPCQTYPYISYWGANYKCHFNKTTTPVIAKFAAEGPSYVKLPSNQGRLVVRVLVHTLSNTSVQVMPVMEHLASKGPLAVNVAAMPWMDYESGVFNGCNNTVGFTLDHVVQLVGYGRVSTMRCSLS